MIDTLLKVFLVIFTILAGFTTA